MNNLEKLEPCPKCGGDVLWDNCRDLDVLLSMIHCDNCDLSFFQVETAAFIKLPNLDYETTVMKYNAWCKTKPTRYFEDTWTNE